MKTTLFLISLCGFYSCTLDQNKNTAYCACGPSEVENLINDIKSNKIKSFKSILFGYETRIGNHIKIASTFDVESILYLKKYKYKKSVKVDSYNSKTKLTSLFPDRDSLLHFLDKCHENCIVRIQNYGHDLTYIKLYDSNSKSCEFPPNHSQCVGVVRNANHLAFKKILRTKPIHFVNDSIFVYSD